MRLLIAATSVAALVSVGAGTALILPDLQADKTSIDDVRVGESAAPQSSAAGAALPGGAGGAAISLANSIELDHPPATYNQMSTEWVVPVSASLAQFPLEPDAIAERSCLDNSSAVLTPCLDENAKCTDPQLAWLEKHAYRTTALFPSQGVFLDHVQIRNASTDGGALSVKGIRPQGEYGIIPGDSFTLTCTAYFSAPIGGAAGSAQARPTTVDLSGRVPAIFGEPLGLGDDPTIDVPAGAPAVVNLAPGQSAILGITSTSPAPAYFKGRLEATVSSGSQTDVVPLTIRGSENFSVAFPSNKSATLQLHGGAMCPEPILMYPGAYKYKNLTACTVADFLKAQGLD